MQFKKKNSSHLRQGKAGGMNGNQQRRRKKHNRLQQRGAEPVALQGAHLGWLEGWKSSEQFTLSPWTYHYIFTPITPNRWAGFTHFLTFCPQGTAWLNTGFLGKGWAVLEVGRKHLALLQAATPSQLWEQTLRFVLHPWSWDTPGLASRESLSLWDNWKRKALPWKFLALHLRGIQVSVIR